MYSLSNSKKKTRKITFNSNKHMKWDGIFSKINNAILWQRIFQRTLLTACTELSISDVPFKVSDVLVVGLTGDLHYLGQQFIPVVGPFSFIHVHHQLLHYLHQVLLRNLLYKLSFCIQKMQIISTKSLVHACLKTNTQTTFKVSKRTRSKHSNIFSFFSMSII